MFPTFELSRSSYVTWHSYLMSWRSSVLTLFVSILFIKVTFGLVYLLYTICSSFLYMFVRKKSSCRMFEMSYGGSSTEAPYLCMRSFWFGFNEPMEDSFRFKLVEYREPRSLSKTLFFIGEFLESLVLGVCCIDGKFWAHSLILYEGFVGRFWIQGSFGAPPYSDFPTESTFL